MNKFPYEQVATAVEKIYAEETDPSDFDLKSQVIEALITGTGWDVGEFFERFTADHSINPSTNAN